MKKIVHDINRMTKKEDKRIKMLELKLQKLKEKKAEQERKLNKKESKN